MNLHAPWATTAKTSGTGSSASTTSVTPAEGNFCSLACQSLDRAEALRAQIDAEGEVQKVKGVLRDHPALKHELQNRSFVAKALARMGLNLEAPVRPVGRPGIGGYGVTHEDLAAMREQDDE
jgi:hypothetical protein